MFLPMNNVLHCTVLDICRDNGEYKVPEYQGPFRALLPEEMYIPQPIHEYLSQLCSDHTVEGDEIRLHLPDYAVPHATALEPHAIRSGSFGIADADSHNAYECYVSPLVTATRCEASHANNATPTAWRFSEWNPPNPQLTWIWSH